MNKQNVVALIIAQLKTDIAVSAQAVEVARDTATHKDCLGSSKYETMGTEASYLAKGQGERLLELERALAWFKQTKAQPSTKAELTSMITLEDEDGQQKSLLLAADAGGLKVEFENQIITVITPHSPLGKALLGKTEGDDFEIIVSGKMISYEVISIT